LGLAAAGFRALDAGLEAAPDAAQAWRRPRARVEEGLRMTTQPVHAAIDVSDGLARDAGHLARASGVQVVIDEARLRAMLHPATFAVAKAVGVDALDLALGGGEDYALLVACENDAMPGFTCIGWIEEGQGATLVGAAGGRRPVSAGFDHFAPERDQRP
jgi:thiamine-monophosphate kinase